MPMLWLMLKNILLFLLAFVALLIVNSLFIFLYFVSDFSFVPIGSVRPPLFCKRSEVIVYLFRSKLEI